MIASREDFARQAVARAAAVRDRFDVPLTAAVNVIDLCIEQYTPRILVRFKDISMEGVYLREPNPEILDRPPAARPSRVQLRPRTRPPRVRSWLNF